MSKRHAKAPSSPARPASPPVGPLARGRQIEDAWRSILEALGYDVSSPHFQETPARVAKFLLGWHTNRDTKPANTTITTFPPGPTPYRGVVVETGLTFHAQCAHHGLPFFGRASIAYLPGEGALVGLSKLPRILDHFAHRFTTQEAITQEVADYIDKAAKLHPRGVAVVLSGEHLCMSMRGVQKPGHRTITSELRGALDTDPALRAEVFSLLMQGLQEVK